MVGEKIFTGESFGLEVLGWLATVLYSWSAYSCFSWPVSTSQTSPGPDRRSPEIENNDDLIDMINHIREVTCKPVGFKAVIGEKTWIGEFLDAVNR